METRLKRPYFSYFDGAFGQRSKILSYSKSLFEFNSPRNYLSFLSMGKWLLMIGMWSIIHTHVFSQDRSTRNNYTGAWTTPESWDPTWTEPTTNINNLDISINGYITVKSSLTFSNTGMLIINDTLVVNGDLEISNNIRVQINDNGILIVKGDFVFSNQSEIIADGYMIVTGNLIKSGALMQGSFTSNDDPSKLFAGGSVTPAALTENHPDYPVLNCTSSQPYQHSGCNYGNMEDLSEDPVYSFFLSSCNVEIPTISPEGPIGFCEGDNVALMASAGTDYLWSTGDTTASIEVSTSGDYTVQVSDSNRCQSPWSTAVSVTVHVLPPAPTITANGPTSFCEGDSVTLTASTGAGYLWSSGETTSSMAVFTSGDYTVQVSDTNGCQSPWSSAVSVTVHALPNAGISIQENSGLTNNDGTICQGETATLTAAGGIAYAWSTGETTAEIRKNAAQAYSVTVTDENGCNNSAETVLNVIDPVSTPGDDDATCGLEYSLNASMSEGSGMWSMNNDAEQISFIPDEYAPDAKVTVENHGSYQFTWTVFKEGCRTSSDVMIDFHAYPDADAGPHQVLDNTYTTRMSGQLLPDETGEWSVLSGSGIVDNINSPVTNVYDLSPGENHLMWTVNSGNCISMDTVIIETKELFIPQVITPNGDGKNDLFIIKGIEQYKPAALRIYNRWGNEVYSNNNYLNDWAGKGNDSRELPNDTYFYVLRFPNGKAEKGFVVIKR